MLRNVRAEVKQAYRLFTLADWPTDRWRFLYECEQPINPHTITTDKAVHDNQKSRINLSYLLLMNPRQPIKLHNEHVVFIALYII